MAYTNKIKRKMAKKHKKNQERKRSKMRALRSAKKK